jgi:ClpP class serine protease
MRRFTFQKAGVLAIAPMALGAEFDAVVVGGNEPKGFTAIGDAAIVDVGFGGPLVGRSDSFFALFCDSYGAILERVAAACASPAKRVILRVDSPGGDAHGCIETARELRAMAQASGKTLIAFVDRMAASAAYALACAADEIVVTPMGLVGSIGCIEGLVDVSKMDQAAGIAFAFVTSGTRKTDGNPHVAITEAAVEAVKERVDGFADIFFGLVDELRGIPSADSQALDGALLFGARATSARLADRVSTWTEVLAGLSGSGETTAEVPVDEEVKALKAKLQEDIDSGDEKKSAKAKRMMAALDESEKEPDEDDDKKKDAASKAKAEEDEKKAADAKAKLEDEKKDAEMRTRAGAPSNELALAARVQALEAERATEKEQAKRDKLLASRPDFSTEVVTSLRAAPMAMLEEAVRKWPRVPGKHFPTAAAANAGASPTRGKTQVSTAVAELEDEEASAIDAKMGFAKPKAGIVKTERALELGFMTPEQASKRASELAKEGAV